MRSEVDAVVAASKADPFDLAAFRRAQRALFLALREGDHTRLDDQPLNKEDALARWLISDLVTIACPLTHADFLMARTEDELKERFFARELSKCPPPMEKDKDGFHLTYREEETQVSRFIHDGGFAAVRWTSLHDKPRYRFWFLFGDFIAGPITDWFGKGVADINVKPTWKSSVPLPSRFFTHTIYWKIQQLGESGNPPPSVRVIRSAVNLLDEQAAETELLSHVR
jgi:hypothetical protein